MNIDYVRFPPRRVIIRKRQGCGAWVDGRGIYIEDLGVSNEFAGRFNKWLAAVPGSPIEFAEFNEIGKQLADELSHLLESSTVVEYESC